jgi:hypothetical protein
MTKRKQETTEEINEAKRLERYLNFATENAEKALWNTFMVLNDLKDKVEEKDPHVVASYLEIIEAFVSDAHDILSMARYEMREASK